VNAPLAEFDIRSASDAKDVLRRARVLGSLVRLSPQRQREFVSAVEHVCRSILQDGGAATVRFSLADREGGRFLEVTVHRESESSPTSESDAPASGTKSGESVGRMQRGMPVDALNKTLRRGLSQLDKLIDHVDTSVGPMAGAMIRMAQSLSPGFRAPDSTEVEDWSALLKAKSPDEALRLALDRYRMLSLELAYARDRERLREQLGEGVAATDNLAILSLVANKSVNGILLLDAGGEIVWINEAFERMTGYGVEQAVGHRADELLFGPDASAESVLELQQALADDAELTHDAQLIRHDGKSVWAQCSWIPVRDHKGQVSRWLGILTDITKRHQTEQALREAKESAEAASRAKSEFLANMSHEIRTPMNAIIGMTELALKSDLTAQQREQLQTVKNSADVLLALLNDILDLSKIEAGKLEIEEVEFNLTDVIRDTTRALSTKAGEKGLALNTDLPEEIPNTLYGDPIRLRQVLLNLMDNAIKFTQHGEVELRVCEEDRRDEEVTLHFAVRDTGIGIAEEQRQRIFESFTQADPSTTRIHGGTGLGLAISAELVQRMGGRIWLESEVGRGSTFHFTVRLRRTSGLQSGDSAEIDSTTASAASSQGDTASRPLRVLVADDHEANRALVAAILAKRGHSVVEAADGQEALDRIGTEDLDLALLDVQMPKIDGYEVAERVRETEAQQGGHLPLIALTAHAMAGDREKCLAAGMDDYLSKPLTARGLTDMVERDRTSLSTDAPRPDRESPAEHDFSATLARLDNDEELLMRQMQFFMEDGPALLRQIDEAIQAGDGRTLGIAAHRLKGLLAGYDANAAASVAQELENLGHSGKLDRTETLYQRLAPMVQRLTAAMRSFVAEHGQRQP